MCPLHFHKLNLISLTVSHPLSTTDGKWVSVERKSFISNFRLSAQVGLYLIPNIHTNCVIIWHYTFRHVFEKRGFLMKKLVSFNMDNMAQHLWARTNDHKVVLLVYPCRHNYLRVLMGLGTVRFMWG